MRITKPLKMSALVGALLIGSSLLPACTTVVAPIYHEDIAAPDEEHGLLLGHIHLTRNGKTKSAGLQWPRDMNWWIEEETQGRRFLLTQLPIEGPYVVKLPAGSYRITDVSFDSIRGIWRAALPTAFSIRPGECTALGKWKLQLQAGFFAGWISRQVLETPHDEVQQFTVRDCPVSVAAVQSSVQSAVTLRFKSGGDEFLLPRDSRD